MPPLISGSLSQSLTITNPLVLYRTLLATKQIEPDPAQHRLAIELQNVYYRLKDYSPQAEYGDRNTLALTRVLTSHEAAMHLKSPRGLLLHGEVGTGKSMLVDLLADSLPNSKKRRWHFNTFMLETLSRLEDLRRSRVGGDAEYSLVWLAKDMIEKSPILFLDEFQLPDRAASKILSNLLTPFFQLGGVLIASSNRMPDELAKASGMDFTAPQKGGLVRKLLDIGGGNAKSNFPADNEYRQFVEVLKARCEIWDMDGKRDWRRREAEEDELPTPLLSSSTKEMVYGFSTLEKRQEETPALDSRHQDINNMDGSLSEEFPSMMRGANPKKYLVSSRSDEKTWDMTVHTAFSSNVPTPIPWKSTTVRVYGRVVSIPRYLEGVSYWTFDELCRGAFGPADYITLASTFHTLVLDDIPILTTSERNEARRLITLLDAPYEARCKLLIRAAAGPDDLFFPERQVSHNAVDRQEGASAENYGGDAVYPETLSEIYQDQISPFRPNISSYTDDRNTGYGADEDSDFGPLQGKSNDFESRVDFAKTSSFTGEDEKFAYKRARSRLWEMCGARWHQRSEPGWWRPLPADGRRWERLASTEIEPSVDSSGSSQGDVKIGEYIVLEEPAGLQRYKRFRTSEKE